MELHARLANIELKISQLKEKNEQLIAKNKILTHENTENKVTIKNLMQKLRDMEETNKMIKLAHSIDDSSDRSELMNKIDQMIREINQCIALINP